MINDAGWGDKTWNGSGWSMVDSHYGWLPSALNRQSDSQRFSERNSRISGGDLAKSL